MQTKIGEKNKSELFLVFTKKQQKNLKRCMDLLRSILIMSNFCRMTLLKGEMISNQSLKEVQEIKSEIDELINHEGVKRNFLHELHSLIANGKIEYIHTELRGKTETVFELSDFKALFERLSAAQE